MMIFNKGKILVLLLVMMMGLSLLSLTPSVKADTVDWVLEGQSPGERTSFVSAEMSDGRIFVALGYNSSEETHINDTWIFDPYEMTWTQVADSPVMTESSTGAYIDGKVYIFGGLLSGYSFMDTVLIYDVAADEWSTGPDMPSTGTYFGSMAIDDHNIMVVGGGTGAMEKCYIFNTVTMTFTATQDLPDGRAGGTLVKFGELLLYFGGWNDTYTTQDEVFVYSIASRYWVTYGYLPEPIVGTIGVTGSDGLIYLLGGTDEISWYSTNFQTAFAYNVNDGSVLELPNLTDPIKYGAAFELDDGRIMYFGGHEGDEGNLGIYSLQIWEKEISLTGSPVDQGDSAWLHIRIKTNFATMLVLHCTVYLTQGDTTVASYEIYSEGTNQLMLELPISESTPAGDYNLTIGGVSIGLWGQDIRFDDLPITIVAALSTDEQLQEIMDQNQELMDDNQALQDQLSEQSDQISALSDDLDDTRSELADVKDSVDGKMDAMFGYIILILVLVTLLVGVIILVRKK